MAAPILQVKRGLLANLPGLRAGEPGFTTDSYDFYVGLTSEVSTNQFVGSGRYWSVGTASKGSGVNLVEGTNNGTDYITLKSPNTLSGIVTYTMPGTDGSSGDVLKTDGAGNLTFSAPAASSFTISDGTDTDTFNTGETLVFAGTASEIETDVTNNQVQIGLPDNVVVGNALTATTFTGSGIGLTGTVTVADGTYGSSTVAPSITVSNGRITSINTNLISGGGGGGSSVIIEDNGTLIGTAGTINFATNLSVSPSSSGVVTVTGAQFSIPVKDSGSVVGSAGTIDFGTGLNVSALSSGIVTVTSDGGSSVAVASTDINQSHYITFVDSNNASEAQESVKTDAGISYNPSTNILTVSGSVNSNIITDSLSMAGVAVTAILDEDAMTSDRADALATQQSIKAYVDSQITAEDLDIAGDTGTGAVDLDSQSLTIAGTANEIETVASNQTITIGLPNDVSVSNNLTVGGNLIISGSTTHVNTTTLNVKDSLVDFGLIEDVSNPGELIPPTSDLNKDIGILLNYYSGSAKKAAVYWDDSVSRIVVSADVSENTGVLTNNTSGALEVASLYVNGCTGSAVEVIGCTNNEVVINNATIDCGAF